MKVALTIYDRKPEIIRSVFSSFDFPGNRPEAVAVCYDRASQVAVEATRQECHRLKLKLIETRIDDGTKGFRCPSKSWNAVFDLIGDESVLCMSSDIVLAPHSIGMADHLAEAFPESIICGRAEHCGPSYLSIIASNDGTLRICDRTMTSSLHQIPLGFAWVLPMKKVHQIQGYSLEYMDGYCYEDDDFVIRMWNAGSDIIFCDDIFGMHIEHARPHVLDKTKVQKNEKIFKEKYGDTHILKDKKLDAVYWRPTQRPGLAVWLHKEDTTTIPTLIERQLTYGDGKDWVAIPMSSEVLFREIRNIK